MNNVIINSNKPTTKYNVGDCVESEPWASDKRYYMIINSGSSYHYLNLQTGWVRSSTNRHTIGELIANDTPIRKLPSVTLENADST